MDWLKSSKAKVYLAGFKSITAFIMSDSELFATMESAGFVWDGHDWVVRKIDQHSQWKKSIQKAGQKGDAS